MSPTPFGCTRKSAGDALMRSCSARAAVRHLSSKVLRLIRSPAAALRLTSSHIPAWHMSHGITSQFDFLLIAHIAQAGFIAFHPNHTLSLINVSGLVKRGSGTGTRLVAARRHIHVAGQQRRLYGIFGGGQPHSAEMQQWHHQALGEVHGVGG